MHNINILKFFTMYELEAVETVCQYWLYRTNDRALAFASRAGVVFAQGCLCKSRPSVTACNKCGYDSTYYSEVPDGAVEIGRIALEVCGPDLVMDTVAACLKKNINVSVEELHIHLSALVGANNAHHA